MHKIDAEIVLATLPSHFSFKAAGFWPQKLRKKEGECVTKIWILLLTRFDGVRTAHLELTGIQVMCGYGSYAEFP